MKKRARKKPDTSFQEFKSATPDSVEFILARKVTREVHTAYVDEVNAHLEEMNEGDIRIIPNPPRTLKVQNLCRMLEHRGWVRDVNFLYGKMIINPLSHEKYAVAKRPYFFKKLAGRKG